MKNNCKVCAKLKKNIETSKDKGAEAYRKANIALQRHIALDHSTNGWAGNELWPDSFVMVVGDDHQN